MCLLFLILPDAIVIQLLSCVQLFVTPWAAAHQVSLSFTISQSLLKLMFIELVMLPNQFSFSYPLVLLFQSFPALESFPRLFISGGQRIGASASAPVLPVNTQGWFPLGLTGLISSHSKGLSKVLFNITVQKDRFFGAQHSLWSSSHIRTWLMEKQ